MDSFRRVFSDWFAPGFPAAPARQSTAHRLILFALLVALGYGLVWLVFSLVQSVLAVVIAQVIQAFCDLGQKPIRFWAVGRDVFFEIGRGRRLQAYLDTRPIFSNLPLLLTLVLVTPGLRWARRASYAAGAGALLFASHVFFIYVKLQIVLITAEHPAAGSPGLWRMFDDLFETTGKTFFPIAIWLVFSLPYMLGEVDGPRPAKARFVSRNSPCPCGSGKKYKKCCGAKAAAW